jgi:ribosomal protein S21
MTVQIEAGWNFEGSLAVFKKLVARDGILREVKGRRFYLSPSQKRRAKAEIARRRKRRDLQRLQRKGMPRTFKGERRYAK